MSGERLLEAYPLTWPLSQARAAVRHDAAFKVSLFESSQHLQNELKLLRAKHVVVSSNVQTRKDGLPYADAREPSDPGVAVYFDRNVKSGDTWVDKPYVIACDHYTKVRFNIRAIGLTVEALRAIQRHGASSMLEQAFTGFLALPAPTPEESWWVVLGVAKDASADAVRARWRELAKSAHPDSPGGSHVAMTRLNLAYERSLLTRHSEPAA